MKKKHQFGNAGPTYGGQANVQAADIAFSIHTSVDSSFYDIEYPEHEWMQILDENQIMRDVNAGATSYAYIVRDKFGIAGFIGNGPNNDIPMVGQSAGAVSIPVAYSAVGARITNEDARQYSMGFNGNLATDLGEAMRKACDNLVEATFFFGQEDLGLLPFINYPGITVQTASTGAAGGTQWTTKTAEEIVADVNDALVLIWKNSRKMFKPGLVILPLDQYALLSQIPMVIGQTGVAESALEYLQKHSIIARLIGQELEIYPSRYLAGAGTAGADRMIIMDKQKDFQCMPFPLPYTLSQPIPTALAAEWYSEQKFGSFNVRQQGSMLYVDGI